MSVYLKADSALCYVPDPVQPFKDSAFEQSQKYYLDSQSASLCAVDWVSSGRSARGEVWDFWRYASRNEVWDVENEGKRRLLLRDNLILDRRKGRHLEERIDGLGIIGTLIIKGLVFEQLGSFFVNEFEVMPRIGIKKWDDDEETAPSTESRDGRRKIREKQEKADRLLWTAARIRGFVLVKFGAREVEGAKRWLRTMINEEGSVPLHFGDRSTLCLR